MKLYFCFLLIIMWFLSGCSTRIEDVQIPEENYIITGKIDLNDSELVKQELYEQHNQWKGTKYRSGGLNMSGVDCSGFVYLTFKYRLGVVLPRSTKEMAEIGVSVPPSKWRAGDMLFFKTGMMERHVGIYIEKGQFLHVSSSEGVKISILSNPYWRKTYWKAKRI